MGGFAQGMILFAIPEHGLLFKCCAEGDSLDLEFGAFFAALRFINESLAGEKIKQVRVHTSNPVFLSAVTNGSRQVTGNPKRKKMLDKIRSEFEIVFCYVEPIKNKTMISPADYSSTPAGTTPVLKPNKMTDTRISFQSIQKGISL